MRFQKGFIHILIIGLVLILIVVVGIFFYFKFKALYQFQETPTPTPSPTVSADETTSWKTYANHKYNYSIKYPQGWNLQSPEGDPGGDLCKLSSSESSIIELASKENDNCGFLGDYIPSDHVELIIGAHDTQYGDGVINNEYNFKDFKRITFVGESAAKYKFTKESEGPAPIATTIYFNHNGDGYVVYLQQPDIGVEYDSFLDKILSTFKFLD